MDLMRRCAEQKISEKDIDLINWLFDALAAIRPAFKCAWPTQKELNGAKVQWIKALIEKGITRKEQIYKGVKSCRSIRGDFINSPAEFIALCKASHDDIGAPPVETAFKIALNNASVSFRNAKKEWVHEAVRHASLKTTSWALSHEPLRIIKPIFEKNYHEACQLYAEGRIMMQIEVHTPDIYEHKLQAKIIDQFKDLKTPSLALQAIKTMLR